MSVPKPLRLLILGRGRMGQSVQSYGRVPRP